MSDSRAGDPANSHPIHAALLDPRPIEPLAEPPDAVVVVPGSKSITNRALVCAALASGTSVLHGALLADDTEAMLDTLDRLGVIVHRGEDSMMTVDGTGGRLRGGTVALDARLSGTTARFIMPILALGEGTYRLDGAEPLRRRPMHDGISVTRRLGADVDDLTEPGHLPVTIIRRLAADRLVRIAGGVSSQFLSGVMLAAPCLADGLTIEIEGSLVSGPYVEMTATVMRAFGADVERRDPDTYLVTAGGYRASDYHIEPDASAASYFFAAAAICGGRIRIDGLGTKSLQGDLRFVDILERMGVEVIRGADFTEVRGHGVLRGVDVDMADISDTAQTLAVTAVFAEGPTRITGIGFIRRKETDRIAATVAELRRCGVDASETDDGIVIEPGNVRGATVDTYDDHRMAMSFSLIGLRIPGIQIADPGCVVKTFPTFFDVLDGLRRADVGG